MLLIFILLECGFKLYSLYLCAVNQQWEAFFVSRRNIYQLKQYLKKIIFAFLYYNNKCVCFSVVINHRLFAPPSVQKKNILDILVILLWTMTFSIHMNHISSSLCLQLYGAVCVRTGYHCQTTESDFTFSVWFYFWFKNILFDFEQYIVFVN